jgi:G3E family GTPase
MAQLSSREIRVAYIQNEFSGVEENPIVKGSDGEVFADFLELANGCVCCTVKTDFVMAIQELLRRRRFEHILVECSGDADPSPVIGLFWVDQELDLGVYLDSVVCVVDSKYFRRNLDLVKGIARQVAFADIVLLNKCDLIDVKEMELVKDSVAGLNRDCRVYSTIQSSVDVDDILNIRAFDIEAVAKIEKFKANSGCCLINEQDPSHSHHDEHHPHESLNNVLLEVNGWLKSENSVTEWLAGLLWSEQEAPISVSKPANMEIYRMKGVLAISNEPKKCFLQAVGSLFEIEKSNHSEWKVDELPLNRLLIIGMTLDEQFLSNSFNSLYK